MSLPGTRCRETTTTMCSTPPRWALLHWGVGEWSLVSDLQYQYASRDHILFCVDASESMHRPHKDDANDEGVVRGKSALHKTLEAVVGIQRSKVITGPADSVGVLLYNVDVSFFTRTRDLAEA